VGNCRLWATTIPSVFLQMYKVICSSHCPPQPTPMPSLQRITSFSIKFFSFHFYDFILFHEPKVFYKTSFQFFLSFWEHVKTWIGQWVIPLHVPYTPPPILHTQKLLLLLFFSSFFIFLIPYSSTNPPFFTNLHFNFF
jgi:hypothetical protein